MLELQKLPDGRYPPPLKSHPYRVFVYGTLKMGQGNHQVMGHGQDKLYLGTAVLSDYVMLGLGAFPAIVKAPDERKGWQIRGEVYDLSDFALNRVNTLEGWHGEDARDNFYLRAEVDLPFHGKAYTYTHRTKDLFVGRAFVPSGDWIGSTLTKTFRWADTDNIPGQILVPIEQYKVVERAPYWANQNTRPPILPPTRHELSNIPIVSLPAPIVVPPKKDPISVGPGWEDA